MPPLCFQGTPGRNRGRRRARFPLSALGVLATLSAAPSPASAHVSERALVLILPTDLYIAFGVAAVVVTVALTALVPSATFGRFVRFLPKGRAAPIGGAAPKVVSTLSFALLLALIVLGIVGPRDPLENLLPLVLLTVWWICFPVAQALFGDLWAWINPWTGPLALVTGGRHPFHPPACLGAWPAAVTYVLAGIYALVDIAPDDPERLAIVAAGYWFFTFVMCLAFGETWLRRGEGFTVFFGLIARISPLAWRPFRIGFAGRAIIEAPVPHGSLAVLSLAALGIGSFDGLNETFWWLGRIGVNPLEFPGRSAVVWANGAGILGAVVLINLVFAICVWTGFRMIGRPGHFGPLVRKLALAILPITIGYHVAHYLTSALVNLQYVLAALDDPLETGASLLSLGDFHVTTSFFNQLHTVQAIWFAQAAAIILAHMLAVILSHAIALGEFHSHRMAIVSQAPVAAFMVLYTLFGLWLLASPVAM